MAAATSSSAIRGGSYNIIFLDEFAFVPTNIAEMFFSSVYPTISSGTKTKMIIVSTPYGMNQFYKLWTDAENKKMIMFLLKYIGQRYLVEIKSGKKIQLETQVKNNLHKSLSVSF